MLEYIEKENGCWQCTSHKLDNQGYVYLNIDGKRCSGHRYMYVKFNRNITKEVIRHTCDNRWCINPKHLIEGSHADNVKDRVVRNRSAIGEKNGRSKLNERQVLDIFNSLERHYLIAKKYNIDPRVVRDIKNKKKWVYLVKDL